jgi:hypothetical protein
VREPTDPFTAALAEMPDLIAALLRDHVPDGTGRCRTCGLPGTGTPHLVAPCPLNRMAQAALTVRTQRGR